MHIFPVRTPAFIKYVFPKLVWNISSSEKELYLTFDDGPTPKISEWILDTLNQYQAKATFFCVGKNVQLYPEIYSQIISEGHTIGNHTYDHLKGWKTTAMEYVKNVKEASSFIDSNLFRPPYGQITPKQSKLLIREGYHVVMWNILSRDWDRKLDKQKCAEIVINNTSSGDIIVFHDSLKAESNMRYALPKVLDYFSERDYVFKRIPESGR